MKKRTWLAILLIIVMLFVFVACADNTVPTPTPEPDPPPPPPPPIVVDPVRLTPLEALTKIADAVPSGEVVNIDISADFSYNDTDYKMVVQGNVKETGSKIKVALMSEEVEKFGLYIIDNKMYIASENNATLYLQDIDVNYLTNLVKDGSQALKGLLENVLNGLGFITFDSLVDMLMSTIIAQSPTLTVDGNVESYSFNVEPKKILALGDLVVSILGSLDLDIPIDVSEVLTYLGTIVPEITLGVDVEITDGNLSKLDLNVTEVGEQVLSMKNSVIVFTDQEVDYNFNQAILNTTEFSLSNMQFSTTLDVQAKEFDVAKYVNALVGKELIPEGFVKIDTDAFEIRLDTSIDLDWGRDVAVDENGEIISQVVDKNYIVLNLLSIDKDTRAEKTLINIYYIDGSFYIDFSNIVSNIYKGSLVKLNLPLNSVISQTLEFLSDTIDKALKGETEEVNSSGVITANILEDGTVSIVPTVESFISAVLGILGQDSSKYVVVEGNTVSLIINSALIGDIASKFSDVTIPDFGDGEFSITFNEYGISEMSISLDTKQGLAAAITLGNFNMMYEPKFEGYDDIVDYINKNLASGSYTDDLTTLVKSLLSSTQVAAGLELTITKGTYNIIDLLTSFGVSGLEGASLNIELTEDSHINLDLNVMVEMGETDNDFKMLVEVKANGAINLGKDVIFTDGELILGLYIVNGSLYIDLSNVNVAGINLGVYTQADFKLASFIEKMIDGKKIAIDVSNMFGNNDGTTEEGGSTEEGGTDTTPSALQGSIYLGLYSNKVVLETTLQAVMSLLSTLGVNANIDGIDLGINASIDSNGLIVSVESTDDTFSGKLTTLNDKYPINIAGADTTYMDTRLDEIVKTYENLDADIVKALFNTIANGSITAEILINEEGKVIDLSSMLKTLIPNYPFDQELKLTLNEGAEPIKIALEWNLNLDDAMETTLQVQLTYGTRSLITVTVVNGNMYVDLSGFGFGKLSIGKDMTTGWINTLNNKILTALPSLDLNKIFEQNKGEIKPPEVENISETDEPTQDKGTTSLISAILSAINIKDNQLMVVLTATTFNTILEALGANIAIDLSADLIVDDIFNGNGIIKGAVDIGEINAKIELALVTGGAEKPVINADEFTDLGGANANKLVRWLLSSTQVSAKLDITLQAGTYNIIELLTNFGIQGLGNAELNLEITEETVLSLGLKVQVMLDEVIGETKMLVEIVALTDTKLGADLLFNAGDKILGFYITENDLYLDASAINVLGIKLGVYRQVGFQLEQFLNTKINEIGQEVAKTVINNSDNTAVEPVVLASDGTSEVPTVENGVVVGISANKIVLKATLSAVIELLKKAGVNINLGNIDLSIDGEISLDTGIILNVSSEGGEIKGSLLALTEEYPIIIGEERAIDGLVDTVASIRDNYINNEENIVKDLINSITTGTISAELTFDTVNTVIDLGAILKQLVPTFSLDTPMTIVVEDTNIPLVIDLEYNIDLYAINNTVVNLTISYGNKSLLNVIVYNRNMYIDLNGFGLGKIAMGIKLTGSWLDALTVKLNNLISKINVDINDIFGEFNGEIVTPEETPVEPPVETPVDDPNANGGSGLNTDILNIILGSMNIRDSKLLLSLTTETISTLFEALLGSSLDFDMSADITVDLINPKESTLTGKIDLEGNIADIKLGINNTRPATPTFERADYTDLGNGEFTDIGMRFLRGLDLNLSIDLVNNTGNKNAANGYNVSGDIYTRISAETLKANRTLGDSNSTVANAGDILLTISTINAAEYNIKGTGSVSNRIYAILRTTGAYAGQLQIALQSGWLYVDVVLAQVDVSTYITNMYIDLGLVDTLGNLMKSLFAGEVQPDTTVEPDPSEGGDVVVEEPSALSKYFANLDITTLLDDITVTLSGINSINASIDFNAYNLNKVIDDLMNFIFGANTIIDMTTLDLFGDGNYCFYENFIAQVVWDRVNPTNFTDSLYEILHYTGDNRKGVLGDIIRPKLPGFIDVKILSAALNDIAGKLTQFVAGILPLPVFNDIGVDINLTDMAIANVTLEGIVDGSAVVNEKGETLTVHSTANNPSNSSWNNVSYTYDAATMSKLTSHYTRLTVYNVHSAIGTDTIDGTNNGIVTWEGMYNNHAYLADAYTTSGQDLYEQYFNSGKVRSIYQLGSTYKRSTSTTIMFNGTIGGNTVNESVSADLLTRMLASPTTYTFKLTSTYADGTTSTMDFVLDINDVVITSIEEDTIYAFDNLPRTVTVNYNDGTSHTVDAEDLNIDYGNTAAMSTDSGVINATIRMYNGVTFDYKINVIGVDGISVQDGVPDSMTINPYEMQRMLTKPSASAIVNATITYTDSTTRTREIDLSVLDFTRLAYNTANTQTLAITEAYTGISWSRDFTVNFSAVTVSGIFTDEALTECVLDSFNAGDTTMVYVKFSDGSVVHSDLYIRSRNASTGTITYAIGYDVEYFDNFNGTITSYQGLLYNGAIRK